MRTQLSAHENIWTGGTDYHQSDHDEGRDIMKDSSGMGGIPIGEISIREQSEYKKLHYS